MSNLARKLWKDTAPCAMPVRAASWSLLLAVAEATGTIKILSSHEIHVFSSRFPTNSRCLSDLSG
jgi:hypothetical protein